MAEGKAKRKLPSKVEAMKQKKRQKLDVGSGKSVIRSKQPSTQPVQLNELQWNQVAMPDRLDDYEGFFGLEEIEDVVVIKDEKTGTISYQTEGSTTALPTTTNGAVSYTHLTLPTKRIV